MLILGICGIAAFIAAQAVNNVSRSAGDFFGTVEASVGGIPSWLFYNDLNSGDYESARDYLSDELRRQYPADRLQEEWETLVEATGGITVGDYEMIDTGSNEFWVQELEGANNHFYSIQVTVRTIGNDYLITDAKPSLIPRP